ncbi:AbrB/MazE/SpoVT family DNA-binding domain-containing protein [Flexilinea flocculi]|jgi:AbrB family looped-hinge helix DNA binding protein|uniref:Protein containing looped-hinge helix DNA binding domain, AbrB family n=1 Tax=Flexilinea flocculi TaxID=1678840 RepID=A0A0S7BS21_9CHLR|nr:AbrB/MazE/SpoVT family DNA-binding domain-containing protein [Flexilinea flocculi]NMB93965.1 AbrB/MazE/SpoVT family DNA-binding domain-containing protein [Flexilinea flocculi]GAP40193.1 protein containing looped-hinge helix DNA binding domain, AbrB family [Flexilinea flocculi]
MTKPSDKKRFYGAITVSDRGQVVIPAEARRDFQIDVGEKILVFGDLDHGLAFVKASSFLEKSPELFAMLDKKEKE